MGKLSLMGIDDNAILIVNCRTSVASKRIGLKMTTQNVTSQLFIRFSKRDLCVALILITKTSFYYIRDLLIYSSSPSGVINHLRTSK